MCNQMLDNEKLQELYLYLFSSAERKGFNSFDAKDLAQDALLKLLEKEDLPTEPDEIKKWASRCLLDFISGMLKKRQNERCENPEPTVEVEDKIIFKMDMEQQLEQLDELERDLIHQYYEGFKYREIAEKWCRSEDWVKDKFRNIRKKTR